MDRNGVFAAVTFPILILVSVSGSAQLPTADDLNQTIRIDGPQYYDGTKNITLKCITSLYNPKLVITWPFGPCNHGKESDTCIFQPDPKRHDNKTVTCRVWDPDKNIATLATYVLHYNYPSPKAPEILDNKTGQVHESEDVRTGADCKMSEEMSTKGSEVVNHEGELSAPNGWMIAFIILMVLQSILVVIMCVLWRKKYLTFQKPRNHPVQDENEDQDGRTTRQVVNDPPAHYVLADDLSEVVTGHISPAGTDTESEDERIDCEQSLLPGKNHSAQGPDHQSTNVPADGGPSQTSVSVDNSKIDTSLARENGNDHSESEENGEIVVQLFDDETLSRGTDWSEHDGAGEGSLVVEENPGRNNSGDMTTSFGHMEGTEDRSRNYLSASGSKGTTASAGSLEATSDRSHERGHARMPSRGTPYLMYSVQSQSGTGSSEM